MSAPQLPNHRHVRLLSDAGGFGEVHLYEDLGLERMAAVKVIRDNGIDDVAVDRFLSEANRMARIEHPNVITIYATGRTSDGRPYLSMQYCPQGSLESRLERERLEVGYVLATGIGVGSALATAHRAGLLHRDVKPGNILTGVDGVARLTDFGIAGAMLGDEDPDSIAVSLEWAPPEMVYTATTGSRQSDVYSLAATLWHLLVGRSPFFVPAGDNRDIALMGRIRDHDVLRTGRADVPSALERVLRQAMAKRSEDRPATMESFVRSLQTVEQDLRLPPTKAVILDIAAPTAPPPWTGGGPGVDTAPRTTVRPARSEPVSVAPIRRAPREPGGAPPRTRLRAGRAADVGEAVDATRTRLRTPTASVNVPTTPDPTPTGRRRVVLAGVGVVLLGAAVAGAVLIGTSGRGQTPAAAPTVTSSATGILDDAIPPGPVTVVGKKVGGSAEFTWEYSASLTSDTFSWQLADGTRSGVVTSPKLTLSAAGTAKVCVQIKVVRATGADASRTWSPPGCVG